MSIALLDADRALSNMNRFVQACVPEGTASTASRFWTTITAMQDTQYILQGNQLAPHLILDALCQLDLPNLPRNLNELNNQDQEKIARTYDTLDGISTGFLYQLQTVCPCIAVVNSSEIRATSGSHFGAIGFVFINIAGRSSNQTALSIVHEAVHTALNIEDLVNGVFPANPIPPEFNCPSAIRKTSRPFHLAFHALAVAVALAQAREKMGIPVSKQELNTARNALEGIRRATFLAKSKHILVLTPYGEQILELLDSTIENFRP